MNEPAHVDSCYLSLQPAAGPPRELGSGELDIALGADALPAFATTAELEPLAEIVGQPRAMQTLAVGLGINQQGFNIFVAGLTGTGKMETIRRSLEKRLPGSAAPEDWVYVNNFETPEEPWAIRLRPGQGRQLRRDLRRLIGQLLELLPAASAREEFNREKDRITEDYRGRFQQEMQRLATLAREHGFELTETPGGNVVFAPLPGSPVSAKPKAASAPTEPPPRSQDQMKRELGRQARQVLDRQQELLAELSEKIAEAERKLAGGVIDPLIAKIRASYPENPRVGQYLDGVQKNLLEHLPEFQAAEADGALAGGESKAAAARSRRRRFLDYDVNVLVDHSQSTTAPIVVEDYPTYKNLFGAIGRTFDARNGAGAAAHFMQIRAGSLLRANGGYLVFNIEDALQEPLVYKNLKRVLKTGRLQLETHDPLGLFGEGGLRPEPIPCTAKVVAVGSPMAYLLLRFYDDEFAGLFKMKAEFETDMDRGPQEQLWYARFVAMISREAGLRPFTRDAVIEIIRFGARRAAQKDKLLTRFSEVADLLRESDYFAAQETAAAVTAEHVRRTLHDRVYRSERIARKIRDLIGQGILMIDVAGARVGQVNGLAVIDTGEVAFGRPSRVTAAVGLGSQGVINIEREARLSGSTHDKGMLILTGYLRQQYGKTKPLNLSASICFEQSYGGIDGDSASSTELYALLSALAEVPLRQEIAVTGSINQWGEIQPVGGINEKIEGFYDVCCEAGLTGRQGVCIPAANVGHVVLRDDVRAAVAAGQFHIYPVATLDQGLELLTGFKAGSPRESGTFHGRVDQQLRAMAMALRDFTTNPAPASLLAAAPPIAPHLPPRMPDETP